MLPQTVLLALVAAVSAVPLNINLGAYSPALVVGDGEISLGGTESATALMSTLASGANGAEGQRREGQAKRGNVRRALDALFNRSPAPTQEDKLAAYEEAMHWIKRDLNGFNAALSYAREAMKSTPKIELGSEGAGVGIVVSPGLNVPANSASNGEGPEGERRAAKRSEVVAEDESPKMTLVAITEV
ncbi:hypothetical protein CC80DRAFT_212092 [Byssothecium circinans]|uniref:Uncharacterized protein n=1 Tax=Byssothecium circinans TaxID=147558 RepID=A0A6A5THJ4_9PLEO|nr:hypothetical protein CC80DRAFT_212092 [Byssothecium circinans]